jgi:hypothetical protein
LLFNLLSFNKTNNFLSFIFLFILKYPFIFLVSFFILIILFFKNYFNNYFYGFAGVSYASFFLFSLERDYFLTRTPELAPTKNEIIIHIIHLNYMAQYHNNYEHNRFKILFQIDY